MTGAWTRNGVESLLEDIDNEDGEADAFLLVDQDAVAGLGEVLLPVLDDGNLCTNFAHSGSADEQLCSGSNRSIPRAVDSSGRRGAAVASKQTKSGRKCTTLAQREAHRRYREKKKQSIAAMEIAVQMKQEELQQLQAENEQLRSKGRVLETAERCSGEIHDLMRLLDTLQELGHNDAEADVADKGGSSCCSSRSKAQASSMGPGLGGTAAAGSSQPSSSQQHMRSSMVGLQLAAAGGTAAPCSAPNTFLQTLMAGGGGAAGASASLAAAAGVQHVPEQQEQPGRLSLQNKAHWMQLAQHYVDTTDQQDGVLLGAKQLRAMPLQPSGGAAGVSQSAGAGAADGYDSVTRACVSGAHSPVASGASPSSTAESGSSVLTDLGSVDTAEQGLVVYKGFLQKASEMLAKVQQLQLQGDVDAATVAEDALSELTRHTIGRLQPFLVERGQGVVYEWNARNLETQQPEDPPADLWPAVLDALQLSEDTQRDMLQCFELFAAPLGRLLEERTALVQRYRQLQSSHVGASNSCSAEEDRPLCVMTARSLEAVAEPLITCMAILKQLAANMERYQSLDGVFAHSLTNLLTGAQIAAACVASYPYLPRWHSMMAMLKQRVQDREQQQRRAGADQQRRRSSRVRTASLAAKEAAYI